MAANGTADGARRARTVAVARTVARAGLVTGFAGLAWLGLATAADASESPATAEPGDSRLGNVPAELSEPTAIDPSAADSWPTAAGSPWSPAPVRTPSFATEAAPVTPQLVIVAAGQPTTTAAVSPTVTSRRPAGFFDDLAMVLDDIALQAASGAVNPAPPTITPPQWDVLDTLGWTSPDPQPGTTYRPAAAAAEPTTVAPLVTKPPVSPPAATAQNPIADTDAAVRTRPSSVPSHRTVTASIRHEVGQRPAHLARAVETVPVRTHPADAPHEPPAAPAPATATAPAGGGTASSGGGSPSTAVTGTAGQSRPATAERRQPLTIDDHDAPVWRSERASTSPD